MLEAPGTSLSNQLVAVAQSLLVAPVQVFIKGELSVLSFPGEKSTVFVPIVEWSTKLPVKSGLLAIDWLLPAAP